MKDGVDPVPDAGQNGPVSLAAGAAEPGMAGGEAIEGTGELAVPALLPDGLLGELRAVVGAAYVRSGVGATLAYSMDANPVFQGLPQAVVAPGTAAQTQAVVRILARERIPFVARGSGTGLSGGACAIRGGVMLDLVRLRGPIEGDGKDGLARVQPGVTNLRLSEWGMPYGRFYAPDPSSQVACTVGGNVAENAGGSHCLKYGVTMNHVHALDVVLPSGEAVRLGGEAVDWPGYDLAGLFVGSEGTFGVVTQAVVDLNRRAPAVRTVLALFRTEADTADTVADIMSAGLVPAAMEMMDRLAMEGVERGPYRVGYPDEVQAVLLLEVDGLEEAVEEEAEHIVALCGKHHVLQVAVAASAEERHLWWQNRKTAFGAMGNLAPSYYVQDGVIPRTSLPDVLPLVRQRAREAGLRVANVFHAGDGNLHPLILFDARRPGETERALAAGSEILRICAERGGSITGEHGVGIEKRAEMALMYSPDELGLMDQVRRVFDPLGLANPGKVLPPLP